MTFPTLFPQCRKMKATLPIRKRVKRVKGHKYRYFELDLRSIGLGVRTSKVRADLEADRTKRLDDMAAHGRQGLQLTDEARADALAALQVLQGRASLVQAASAWVEATTPAVQSVTIAEVCQDIIASRTAAGRRDRTMRELRDMLGRFCEDVGPRTIADVTTDDIRAWIQRRGYHGQTQRKYITKIRGIWAHAIRKGLAAANPAMAIDMPGMDETAIHIMTPETTEAILRAACSTHGGAMVPYLAIGIFAGLRPERELTGLGASDIRLGHGVIHVGSGSSKLRAQRLVPVEPNLTRWLLAHPVGRSVHYSRRAMTAIRKAAGVSWSPDIMRHTFASYWLAKHKDIAQLAEVMQSSPKTIRRHYRNLVLPADAERFWQITPDSVHSGLAGEANMAG